MNTQTSPNGTVHKLPTDLQKALTNDKIAHIAWQDITPLACNEFICWIESAKQTETRQRRITRTSVKS